MDSFQQTIDHRYDDLPTRPFVPWRASLSSYEMQRFRRRPEVPVPTTLPSCARAKRRRLDVRRIVFFALLPADGVLISFVRAVGASGFASCIGPLEG